MPEYGFSLTLFSRIRQNLRFSLVTAKHEAEEIRILEYFTQRSLLKHNYGQRSFYTHTLQPSIFILKIWLSFTFKILALVVLKETKCPSGMLYVNAFFLIVEIQAVLLN